MMHTPDAHSLIEISRFLAPPMVADHRSAPVNARGYLRVMFTVEDIDGTLARLGKRGAVLLDGCNRLTKLGHYKMVSGLTLKDQVDELALSYSELADSAIIPLKTEENIRNFYAENKTTMFLLLLLHRLSSSAPEQGQESRGADECSLFCVGRR